MTTTEEIVLNKFLMIYKKSMVSSFACVTDISKYSLNPSFRESGQGKEEKNSQEVMSRVRSVFGN